MARRSKKTARDPKTVTFRPEPGSPYGVVSCSWEDKPRKVPITRAAVEKFAEGWKAELVVEAAW